MSIFTDLVPVPGVVGVDHRRRRRPKGPFIFLNLCITSGKSLFSCYLTTPVDLVVQLRHLPDRPRPEVAQDVLEELVLGIVDLRGKRRVGEYLKDFFF